MRICLVSADKRLYKLCREVLAEIRGREWCLQCALPGEQRPEADLTIWDYTAGAPLPPRLEFGEEQRNIFLVPRGELAAFENHLPLAAVSILLKPVNQATFRAFLEQAVARNETLAGASEAVRIDRGRLLQCLLEANLRLQEQDQDRTNFLARALHDFRAPLTAINGYCGLLLSRQLGGLAGEQAVVLERMQHSVQRLTRMTNAMYQLSIGRRVEMRPDIRESDIGACVEQALHEIMPLAEEKNLRLAVKLEDPAQPLWFDPSQIEQVLINLLDNACKFSPKGDMIEIRGQPTFWDRRAAHVTEAAAERRREASERPNAYRVSVSDSGPGVPPERLEKIFEEYTSYAGSQDRAGGGLGLAICKLILSMHQGRIFAESRGTGATFAFLLPFAQQNSPRPIDRPGRAHGDSVGVVGVTRNLGPPFIFGRLVDEQQQTNGVGGGG